MTSVLINHDEKECASLYSNECYYTIVLKGTAPKTNTRSKYLLSSFHGQQNH
jgi:hypothetical protein